MPLRLDGPHASNHQPGGGNVPQSSREKSELIEFKLMKCNTQMYSCKSAVTLYWRRGEMKCTSGHLQGGWIEMFNKTGYKERQIETGVDG